MKIGKCGFNCKSCSRPDATMIPNNYTYTDVPLYQSGPRPYAPFPLQDFLKLDVLLIGLVKGANLCQMDLAIRKQVEMGHVSFAMPVDFLASLELSEKRQPVTDLRLQASPYI
ncbi:MAG: hypothetical protein ACUVQY_07105, partial [Thermoproteota archaeon]